jgi:hypothetical protein
MAGSTGGPTPRERRRALARIALGQAQIVAAVVGLVLFATTLVAVVVAGVLVAVSKVAFRDRGYKGGA